MSGLRLWGRVRNGEIDEISEFSVDKKAKTYGGKKKGPDQKKISLNIFGVKKGPGPGKKIVQGIFDYFLDFC